MSKRVGILLLLFFVQAVPAFADFISMDIQIDEVDSLTVWSTFTASNHQLAWSNGGLATLYDTTGGFAKFRVNVTSTFTGMTDNSLNGLASAAFANGNFTITFFATTDSGKTNPLGSAAGEIYPGYTYNEHETQENPSRLYGAAPMRLNSWTLNGYSWAEGTGVMGGLTGTTTNINGNGNISNYQSNWTSHNTIVRLTTDENSIPEPATIGLLGLGAALAAKRKRA
jgi:hypothetical protein